MNWKNRYGIKKGQSIYKIGDKVMIKKDLNTNNQSPLSVNEDMVFYAGKTAIIIKCINLAKSYKLDVDDGEWSWDHLMFE